MVLALQQDMSENLFSVLSLPDGCKFGLLLLKNNLFAGNIVRNDCRNTGQGFEQNIAERQQETMLTAVISKPSIHTKQGQFALSIITLFERKIHKIRIHSLFSA